VKEIWKPVPHKPFDKKYIVSNLGNVKPIKKSKFSHMRGDFLKPGVGARGYAFVTLYYNRQNKQTSVHRMVAYAFLGNPSEGKTIVCHLDDNKLNNRADNLIWSDPAGNMRHMVEHRRSLVGSKNPRALLSDVEVLTIRRLYEEGSYSQTALAITYGVEQTQISRIVLRKAWKHI
jgi:NUMOD4 motif-containing protein/HNH endonuclease